MSLSVSGNLLTNRSLPHDLAVMCTCIYDVRAAENGCNAVADHSTVSGFLSSWRWQLTAVRTWFWTVLPEPWKNEWCLPVCGWVHAGFLDVVSTLIFSGYPLIASIVVGAKNIYLCSLTPYLSKSFVHSLCSTECLRWPLPQIAHRLYDGFQWFVTTYPGPSACPVAHGRA